MKLAHGLTRYSPYVRDYESTLLKDLYTTEEKFTFGYNGLISTSRRKRCVGSMKRDSSSNFSGLDYFWFQIGCSIPMISIFFHLLSILFSLLNNRYDNRDETFEKSLIALPNVFFSSPCTSALLRYPKSLSTFV